MFKYTFLPFQFRKLNNNTILLVNECGDYFFLNNQQFDHLINNPGELENDLLFDLESRHIIAPKKDLAHAINMIAIKYRSRMQFLNDFTSLHMMVVTLRCNHKCNYCQVSSEDDDKYSFDMDSATAKKIVEYIFMTPSQHVKIEFQGGEPLLNWSTVVKTVLYAEKMNKKIKKNLSFVLCTNLISINEKHIQFIKDHNIDISTSLDGPKRLHDKHRVIRSNSSSYDVFMKKLSFIRSKLDEDKVSALMTITYDSLYNLEEVVDEYINLGFNGIFFRPLNPYGAADKNKESLEYSISEYIHAYKAGLDYIIKKNIEGYYFLEFYSALLMSRILTPFSTGFVDLQSPSGAGISGVIYDYNGDVYPADEARMLARMGEFTFKMGNVFQNSYFEIFKGNVLQNLIRQSCVELMPGCFNCAYRSFCGADPIRNYVETKDVVGKRSDSSFCKRNMGIFDFLFSKILASDKNEIDVFWSWITRKDLREINNENS